MVGKGKQNKRYRNDKKNASHNLGKVVITVRQTS